MCLKDQPTLLAMSGFPGVLCLTTTSFFMAIIGAKTADRTNRDKLRKIFGMVLSIVGLRLAYSGFVAGGFGF